MSLLHVPVMAAPTVLETSLQEFIKQGPILREIQCGMTDLCSRVGDLECKRRRSSSCARNTSERNAISKKWKLLGNESDEDSDIEISIEETSHLHIPEKQPSTSKELDKLLSDGELVSDDESDDDSGF